MKRLKNLLLSIVMLASSTSPALAQAQEARQVAAPELAEGEVRKVDKSAGKITIRHGHLPRLDMTGMTMVFRVADPRMLEQVKPGDKVLFDADKVDGAYTVTRIEPAQR